MPTAKEGSCFRIRSKRLSAVIELISGEQWKWHEYMTSGKLSIMTSAFNCRLHSANSSKPPYTLNRETCEYFHPPAYITGRLLTQPTTQPLYTTGPSNACNIVQDKPHHTSANTWHNFLTSLWRCLIHTTNFPGDSGTFMKLINSRDGNCLHIIIVLAKSATLNSIKCFGYDLWWEIYNFH